MSTRHNIFSLVLHKAALFDLWNWLAPSTESIAGLNTFKPIFYFKKIINIKRRIPNHKYFACNDFIVILRFLFILPRQGSVFLNRTKVESWSPIFTSCYQTNIALLGATAFLHLYPPLCFTINAYLVPMSIALNSQ